MRLIWTVALVCFVACDNSLTAPAGVRFNVAERAFVLPDTVVATVTNQSSTGFSVEPCGIVLQVQSGDSWKNAALEACRTQANASKELWLLRDGQPLRLDYPLPLATVPGTYRLAIQVLTLQGDVARGTITSNAFQVESR